MTAAQGPSFQRPGRIIDREDDYRKRRLARMLSPSRNDAFAMGDKTPDARVRTYADVMKQQLLDREKDNTVSVVIKIGRTGADGMGLCGLCCGTSTAGA